jgi:phage repressor protein C with HTH and peptisase S24 domain
MEPLLRAGDWVGVRLEQRFRRGDLVVAEIGLGGEVVVKRFGGVRDGWLQLQSVNPDHDHIVVRADQGRVRGLVWGLWRPPEAANGA